MDAKAQKRAQRSPAEKDKARAKDRDAKAKKQMKRERFCRGFVSDEERELHTVWILDKDKVPGVAKLMFSEEVFEEEEGRGGREFHRGKSKFILVKSKPDDDDKKFVKDLIERGGFTFRHDRKKYNEHDNTCQESWGHVPDLRFPLLPQSRDNASYALSTHGLEAGLLQPLFMLLPGTFAPLH
jgi:hypothetical protein